MGEFSLRTQILTGEGALRQAAAGSRRCFVVTDSFLAESGKLRYVLDTLDADGTSYEVFSDVKPDPDIREITAGARQMRAFGPDLTVAFGGGSAIDSAKAMLYFTREAEAAQGRTSESCRLVAVPTTSGTGSEVTKFSVVSNREKGEKYPLVDDSLLPDIAVLDETLTLTVPPAVTADTGIDVLTHAVEAAAATGCDEFSLADASRAAKLVFRYLPVCFDHPDDRQARRALHYASCLAGIAFNAAGLGICHSLAHAAGGRFHLPHGRTNGVLLPYVLAFNPPEAYLELAGSLGIDSRSPRQAAMSLIRQIERLRARVKLPATFREAGIPEDGFLEAVPQLAETALGDICTATNPRPCTKEELMELYRRAYAGERSQVSSY